MVHHEGAAITLQEPMMSAYDSVGPYDKGLDAAEVARLARHGSPTASPRFEHHVAVQGQSAFRTTFAL